MTPRFYADFQDEESNVADLQSGFPDEYQATKPSPMVRGADWARCIDWPIPRYSTNRHAEWFIQCQLHGIEKLNHVVNVDRGIRGGVPVLQGTRFPISQLIAELSETSAPDEIAENFDLSADQIREFLDGFALLLDKPPFK